jgi:glutaminyl-peptide cyclotransferase
VGKRLKITSQFFPAIIFLSGILIFSCREEKKPESKPAEVKPVVSVPAFNADSAYEFVRKQCEFGPRVPNTKAHVECGDYLITQLKSFSANVNVQSGMVKTFDGTQLKFRNIIGSFNPQASNRILLFAHWDTRPWCDQDTVDKDKPSLGANDGGSGVAVLLEVARQLGLNPSSAGIDIIFFDAEDWGKEGGGPESEDTYALGTQYWAAKPHVPGYTASYGILLDMVGAKNAQFRYEGLSKQNAGFVLDHVWKTAASLGFSDYFLFQDGGWVTDDHLYVNEINIPSIDIIHSDLSTKSGFPSHWHTHRDNMDVIDRNTLRAVGQTLLGVLYNHNL